MSEKTRGSGNAPVRVDVDRLTGPYRRALDESTVQRLLARELSVFGWTVLREVGCRPRNGKVRRADLYCVAPPWFGETSGAIVNRCENARNQAARSGFVLAIEAKHDDSTNAGTDAAIQAVDYIGATAWCDAAGRPLVRPDWAGIALRRDLSGGGEPGDYQRAGVNHWVDRILWRQGVSTLHRDWSGNLALSIRLPKVLQRKGRRVFTSTDSYMALTRWDIGRRSEWGAP